MSVPLSISLNLPPDRFLSCAHCGITFVWTGWEQTQDDQEPAHCPGCRYLRAVARQWGVVKWFDPRRRFGFITMADGNEIYVRGRDVTRGKLRRGALVSFRVIEGTLGPRAIKVRVHRARSTRR